MSSYRGPMFQQVDTIHWQELEARGGFQPRQRPLLVKGAVERWPASQQWTFEGLAARCQSEGAEVVTSFQNGLVEQGVTREPVIQPVAPYLRQLAAAATEIHASNSDQIGLMPNHRRKALTADERFTLDWEHLKTFKADEIYLAQWNILDAFPDLRQHFEIRRLWPGLRRTWEYTFIGPANTVTGLHHDFPNNWFCQITGVKEFILFPPDQSAYLCTSRKYDWGATLSDIDISRLDQQPWERTSFAKAEGIYARVEAGDALFLPSRTWHAVVALEPSISLAVFGLTPWELIAGGVPLEIRARLHGLHLYRWGNCTCHRMSERPSARASVVYRGPK